MAIYLSEALAQEAASRLRRREPAGAVLSSLRPVYVGALRGLCTPAGRRRLRVAGEVEAVPASGQVGPVEQRRHDALAKLLARWTRRALAAQLVSQRDRLMEAAALPQDGVTIVVRFAQPPGLSLIAAAARGRGVADTQATGPWAALLRARPDASLQIVPGYHRA